MANLFRTVQDLVGDALWLAGETNSTANPWYQRATDYLNAALLAIVAGATLGDRQLAAIDWWWARSPQRGQFIAQMAYNSPASPESAGNTQNNSITLTNGSSTVAVGPNALNVQLVGGYLSVGQFTDQIPTVTSQSAGGLSFTIDLPWQGRTQTTTQYFVAFLDYPLPADLLRISGPIVMGRWPYEIPVTTAPEMEHVWPRGQLFAGTPEMASIVTFNPPTLRLNRFLTDNNVVMEFEYLVNPPPLSVGGPDPIVPYEHRRILSLGAAYLMLIDKIDARSNQVFGQFITAWEGMQSDHSKQVGNPNYARLLVRPTRTLGARQLLRTSSGMIIG